MSSRLPSLVRSSICVLIGVALLPNIGCRSFQLGVDQADIRQTLLKLYTDQVLDNLVRARNGFPIIHLDYNNITGTITQTGSGEVGDSQLDKVSRLGFIPGQNLPAESAFPNTSAFEDTLAFKISGNQTTQLTITAQPVINNTAIYDAYLEYLGLPDRLAEGDRDPGEKAHVKQRFQGRYYWVPKQYRGEFFRLALRTTCLRSGTALVPRDFKTKVQSVLETSKAEDGMSYRVLVRFVENMLNDNGEIRVAIAGRELSFTVHPIKSIEGKEISAGAPTDQLYLLFVPAEVKKVIPNLDVQAFVEELHGADAVLRLENYRPSDFTVEDRLEPLRHQLELFRLNQRTQ